MAQTNKTQREKNTVSAFHADEERVMLALAWAEHSMTLSELSASLETSAADLREAMRSLYRHHFLLISRGIRQIEDTSCFHSPPARMSAATCSLRHHASCRSRHSKSRPGGAKGPR